MTKSERMPKRNVTLLVTLGLFFLFSLALGALVYKTTIAVKTNSSITTIYVDPQTTLGAIGQNFTVKINISDVIDLYGWEFKLGWNATILDVIDVREGSFLRKGGETFFWSVTNNTVGYILVDCTLLGSIPGVNGNGTLAIVEFHVETVGECPLDLYDTILVNSEELSIQHMIIDGYYRTSVHDVAVVNLVASESNINVTVENQGTHVETFNVSTYYRLLTDPLIGTQTITLEPGAKATLTFAWTPPTSGRYKIRAEANIVPEETDTADNIRTTTIYVNQQGSNSETAENTHLATFIYSLLAATIIIPGFLRKKKIQIKTLTIHFKHYSPNNVRNIWNDLIRRHVVFA